MSYIVMKIYSFECDWHLGCDEVCEVGPGEPGLRAAERVLRHSEHWQVQGNTHICPKHQPTGEPA